MKIALVGNQNSGKTTLFNLLTGMNSKIGNWPGVTIEKKSGIIKNTNHEIVDLPGIYSLSPYSIEEEISRKFIFEENPEVIINIIDSTSLERSLYLTTQLLELDLKVIVALNMTDILEKKGINIDINKLENLLGTRVVKISALKKTGIDELIRQIKIEFNKEKTLIYEANIENAIKVIEEKIKFNHKRFIAIKLIEKDERFKKYSNYQIWNKISKLENNYKEDLEEIIATQRYKFIEKVKQATFSKIQIKKESRSDKLDKIFLNKYLAYPIFIIIIFFIYYLSVGVVGKYTLNLMENLIEIFRQSITQLLININISNWLISLITNGIITGVGTVISFIPQLMILFLCIGILETSGYMSRIAMIFDSLFRKIGLSGKSLIPFIIGSGCSVPGIMGSRIIENEEERKMTAILTPFIPCSAKLPIIALFSGYFFKEKAGFVSASLYFLSVIVIIFCAILMKRFVYKKTSNIYISELPEYKKPNLKYVLKDVYEKTIAFIKRAGSVILVCSVFIWFLISYSPKLIYGVKIEDSILAFIGKKISWIFYPIIGKNSWEITVSIIQGLVAKEQVIASMKIILGNSIFDFFTKASAYSFIVFNLFSAPCLGAIGTMKKELGDIRKILKVVFFQIVFAWIFSFVIYQIGNIIENNLISISDILIFVGILILIFNILKNISNKEKRCNNCNKFRCSGDFNC